MTQRGNGRRKNRVTCTPVGGERASPGPTALGLRRMGDTTVAVHPRELSKRESLNKANRLRLRRRIQGGRWLGSGCEDLGATTGKRAAVGTRSLQARGNAARSAPV